MSLVVVEPSLIAGSVAFVDWEADPNGIRRTLLNAIIAGRIINEPLVSLAGIAAYGGPTVSALSDLSLSSAIGLTQLLRHNFAQLEALGLANSFCRFCGAPKNAGAEPLQLPKLSYQAVALLTVKASAYLEVRLGTANTAPEEVDEGRSGGSSKRVWSSLKLFDVTRVLVGDRLARISEVSATSEPNLDQIEVVILSRKLERGIQQEGVFGDLVESYGALYGPALSIVVLDESATNVVERKQFILPNRCSTCGGERSWSAPFAATAKVLATSKGGRSSTTKRKASQLEDVHNDTGSADLNWKIFGISGVELSRKSIGELLAAMSDHSLREDEDLPALLRMFRSVKALASLGMGHLKLNRAVSSIGCEESIGLKISLARAYLSERIRYLLPRGVLERMHGQDGPLRRAISDVLNSGSSLIIAGENRDLLTISDLFGSLITIQKLPPIKEAARRVGAAHGGVRFKGSRQDREINGSETLIVSLNDLPRLVRKYRDISIFSAVSLDQIFWRYAELSPENSASRKRTKKSASDELFCKSCSRQFDLSSDQNTVLGADCAHCGGSGYAAQALALRLLGLGFEDVKRFSVGAFLARFTQFAYLNRIAQLLVKLGLSEIRLGQAVGDLPFDLLVRTILVGESSLALVEGGEIASKGKRSRQSSLNVPRHIVFANCNSWLTEEEIGALSEITDTLNLNGIMAQCLNSTVDEIVS